MGEVYDPATRAVGGAVTGEATGGGAAAGRAAGGGFGRGTARGDGGSTPAEGIREAVAADASALGELAGAALTLDAEEAPRLVALLSAPPPERRWTALVTGDLDGVVFASMSARDRSVGHIDLLAVHPAARGRGAGRALVAAAEDWLRGEGAAEARFAGNPPCYAWPGIDVRYTAAACLAESLGYERYHAAWNMTADLTAPLTTDTDLARLAREGVTVHAAGPADRAAVRAFVRENWNENWAWEVERATGCHYASRRGEILGFAAWGARPAWFGPMGTAPAARGLGIGRVLLRRCLAEQRDAGLTSAQISWVGPMGFYSRAVGAHTERVFWLYGRGL
ncbi:GNAT family N-acetyltransferase [Streptosporangium lutulentum]|uniref:GNAT superfamily N-acetyltransferase n=1 Tax=Streptosporangium lutulentum TaxID=1461250 RepID=A0ABT9QBB4_9ACTN|nr:GNAT family N-acetyltransferase [Streptosporangium lutulentum]MDP9844004.1 GNAT superfamily N-acetyltransferase [Streptosporangium lutulentum]